MVYELRNRYIWSDFANKIGLSLTNIIKKEVIFIERYYDGADEKDGYYTLVEYIFESDCIQTINWYIPEKLLNNKYVRDSMKHKLIEELVRSINDIANCNRELSYKYLDVERKPFLNKKEELKEKCYEILKRMNVDLSPYHWEVQKDSRNNRRNHYLVGLFAGENETERMIRSL